MWVRISYKGVNKGALTQGLCCETLLCWEMMSGRGSRIGVICKQMHRSADTKRPTLKNKNEKKIPVIKVLAVHALNQSFRTTTGAM